MPPGVTVKHAEACLPRREASQPFCRHHGPHGQGPIARRMALARAHNRTGLGGTEQTLAVTRALLADPIAVEVSHVRVRWAAAAGVSKY